MACRAVMRTRSCVPAASHSVQASRVHKRLAGVEDQLHHSLQSTNEGEFGCLRDRKATLCAQQDQPRKDSALASGCAHVERTDSVVLSQMIKLPSTLPVALYGIEADMCAASMESV